VRAAAIGAAVLLGIGIVGFPLVFGTAAAFVNIDRGAGKGRRRRWRARGAAHRPATNAAVPAPACAGTSKPAAAATAAPPVIAGAGVRAARSQHCRVRRFGAPHGANGRVKPAAAVWKPAAEPKAAEVPRKPAEPKPPPPSQARYQRRRAPRALLEQAGLVGSDAAGRFVVQVGAFSDVAAALKRRQVEKLGLKTYTQVTSTAGQAHPRACRPVQLARRGRRGTPRAPRVSPRSCSRSDAQWIRCSSPGSTSASSRSSRCRC
jgi:DedD protein